MPVQQEYNIVDIKLTEDWATQTDGAKIVKPWVLKFSLLCGYSSTQTLLQFV